MKKLVMLRGLPGSGKSTWAKEQVEASYAPSHRGPKIKRLNKDLIREMLDFSHWSRDNEQFVIAVRDMLVVKALMEGHSVIVDDTGFGAKHVPRLSQLAAQNGATFEIQDFTNVSVETCIERDLKRINSVGEAVIRKMYRDYLAPKPPVIEYDPKLSTCIICDIDGTVAIMNGRGPYEEDKVETDKPNLPVVNLVRQLYNNGDTIFFVSGRHEKVRQKTLLWLDSNVISLWPQEHKLFMRSDDDNRHDHIIKTEIFEREFRGKYNVRFCLDDRTRVVEGTWRALGIPCFQVANGDF